MNPKDYRIICIMGKAGAGKDTLMGEIVKLFPHSFAPVISFTSRPKREKEINGVDYHFISKSDFMLKIKNGTMIEWTYFNDWYYGTAEESFDKNKVNICVCNPEGVAHFTKLGFDPFVIYLDVPAKTRLLRYLNREENPDVDEIIRRYQADEKNFKDLKFNLKIQNGDDVDVSAIAKTLGESLLSLGKN